jgi:hypothetical protein
MYELHVRQTLTSYTYLQNGHGHPDFTPNTAPPPETYEYQALRNQISDATMDMHRLVNGPLMTIHTLSFAHSHLAAFQVALSRKYFHIVPDNGIGLSAVEIAREAGMDEDRTRRILKILANQRTFQEVGLAPYTSHFFTDELVRSTASSDTLPTRPS